ncbi:MAG: DNA repair protein RadA [Clostridiales bacterium]|nr:DNA repair protein RadA [Clostridiales bacterium]
MAVKSRNVFICEQCGYESVKWYGKCPGCGEWNSMAEQVRTVKDQTAPVKSKSLNGVKSISINNIDTLDEHRYSTGINELDRVLGGGIVKGSLVLIGGDPGIGKSTLLLQMCGNMANGMNILYVSGEESARQLKLRASRLGVESDSLFVFTETDAEAVYDRISSEKPDLVVIDSIQTMSLSQISSSPGSITQVRECTSLFMRCAKSLDIPIMIVSHVNKDGAIAGPKVLEHIVDAVLYFEGDRQMTYRILRAIKNRFGSTNEIGVFEMVNKGLREVENPSLMLIAGRPKNVSGTCVTSVMEGTRPILAEIQGLAAGTGFGTPRRMCTGFDYNRMAMIIAVLEKRAGFYFSNADAYVNVVGGLRLDEPSVDLAVAVSLISSLKDVPVPENVIVFGEVGLAGEIRSVSHAEERVVEAARLGFTKCVLPMHNYRNLKKSPSELGGIELVGVSNIREAYLSITRQ